jgi:hypothetical protein
MIMAMAPQEQLRMAISLALFFFLALRGDIGESSAWTDDKGTADGSGRKCDRVFGVGVWCLISLISSYPSTENQIEKGLFGIF